MPVVDASVVVDLVAPDVEAESGVRRLFGAWAAGGAEVHAPGLLWTEGAEALVAGIRQGRWEGAAADAAAAHLASLPVLRSDIPADAERAFELSRRYDNWPARDMLYVALAGRLGTELVTADDRLVARLAHLGWVRASA